MAESKTEIKRGDAAYLKLLTEVKTWLSETAVTGSQALDSKRLNSYWLTGRRLHRLRDANGTIARLAKDMNLGATVLYRSRSFFETWPDGLTPEAKKLSWRQHQPLLGLGNARERDFYVKTALARGWNRDSIKRALLRNYYASSRDEDVDNALTREADPLHVYKAVVERVVDGDTLQVKIDVGFRIWSDQRVRLRGLNASELAQDDAPVADAEGALKAKLFVEEKLRGVPFIVLKTHKTDLYGRYVADVFYHPTFEDKRDVAVKGFYLNEELLREGLSVRRED